MKLPILLILIPLLLGGWLLTKLAQKYPPYDWTEDKARIDAKYAQKLRDYERSLK